VARQLQVPDDLRAQQADDIAEDREPEARKISSVTAAAAQYVASFEDEGAHPRRAR
jgi:hypothetical protein